MATSVIKPANAGIDLPISLPTSGWSSNQWTYSNSAITADCAIEVEFKAGTLNTNVPYIEYDKVSGGGGIVFTVPSVPTVAIPVIAHVYYTQAGAFTTAVDTAITTTGSVESLGANVHDALDSLNSKLPWKCHTIIKGTGNVDLPTNANEYLFILSYGTAPNVRQALSFTFYVPNDETRISGYTLTDGYYLNSSAYSFAQMYVNCTTHKANITSVNISGNEYNSTSFISVYYR